MVLGIAPGLLVAAQLAEDVCGTCTGWADWLIVEIIRLALAVPCLTAGSSLGTYLALRLDHQQRAGKTALLAFVLVGLAAIAAVLLSIYLAPIALLMPLSARYLVTRRSPGGASDPPIAVARDAGRDPVADPPRRAW